jgi:hypothetical protein
MPLEQISKQATRIRSQEVPGQIIADLYRNWEGSTQQQDVKKPIIGQASTSSSSPVSLPSPQKGQTTSLISSRGIGSHQQADRRCTTNATQRILSTSHFMPLAAMEKSN